MIVRMRYYFKKNKAVKLNEDETETTELLDVAKYSFVNPIEFDSKVGTMTGEVIDYVEPIKDETIEDESKDESKDEYKDESKETENKSDIT